jgi:hypothetical protein
MVRLEAAPDSASGATKCSRVDVSVSVKPLEVSAAQAAGLVRFVAAIYRADFAQGAVHGEVA